MAGRWRDLPARTTVPEREVVEALRAMKTGTGLSLVELAARTHYSKSSWQRWLNADRLVTEPALRMLCEIAGLPEEKRCALLGAWKLAVGCAAEKAEKKAAGDGAAVPDGSEARPAPGRWRRPRRTLPPGAVVITAGVAVGVFVVTAGRRIARLTIARPTS